MPDLITNFENNALKAKNCSRFRVDPKPSKEVSSVAAKLADF